jgi:predicted CoA-binding protein
VQSFRLYPATSLSCQSKADERLNKTEDSHVRYVVVSANSVPKIPFTQEQNSQLIVLMEQIRGNAAQPASYLDPVARSDQEYAMETWLDENAVPDPWEIAPILVTLGYNPDGLATFSTVFSADQLPLIIHSLGATYDAYHLLNEISQGAGRISEIVKALKSYAYLDQAPVQDVDIHQGLDNTLLILRHKLAKINVVRAYNPQLPHIQAYGSELNQVWTNIIDNAADALEKTSSPQITLRTSFQGDWIQIEIEDNGPGIPESIQSRIFDPFFTTKPPGKGTGLGLEITYNIIVNKHRGDIKVFSQPGKTVFRVELPVSVDSQASLPKPVEAAPDSDQAWLKKVLENIHTIAVVGISSNPDRPGNSVPAYLQAQGYRIIPVNPNLESILGEKAYPDLLSIPEKVDAVQIFRRIEDVPPIVEQAIQIGAKVVWMQEGIVHNQAAELAKNAGLTVVMDHCMRAVHRRVFRSKLGNEA